MRLRGFSLMTNILEDYGKDLDIISLVRSTQCKSLSFKQEPDILFGKALECMLTWPLLHRNKVEDSKVSVPVSSYAEAEDEVIKTLAQKVSTGDHEPLYLLSDIMFSFLIIGIPWRQHIGYQRG